jgi:hypothetical protein
VGPAVWGPNRGRHALALVSAALLGCACSGLPVPLPTSRLPAPATPSPAGCGYLAPRAPAHEGDGGRCGLRLGAELLQADCVAGTGLVNLQEERFDVSLSKVSHIGAPTRDAQGCHLTAGGAGTADRIASTVPLPADVVLIADFQLPAATVDEVHLELRCTPSKCLFFVLLHEDEMDFTDDPTGRSTSVISGAGVDVSPGQVIRLVATAKGSTAQAWLNGRDLGTASVQTAGAGMAAYSVIGRNGLGPQAALLRSLLVFQRS